MTELRALTVRQPFAWAIAYGGKDVENRGRPLAYRGLLAIHAGLELAHPGFFPTSTPLGRAAAVALDAIGGRGNCWNPRHRIVTGLGAVPHPGLALGALIAVVDLVGCHDDATEEPRTSCSPWALPGQCHLMLRNPRPLAEPVPCRGSLVLGWRLPDDVEKAVRAQLTESPGRDQ